MPHPKQNSVLPLKDKRRSARYLGTCGFVFLAWGLSAALPSWADDDTPRQSAPEGRAARSAGDSSRSEANPTANRAPARMQEESRREGGTATTGSYRGPQRETDSHRGDYDRGDRSHRGHYGEGNGNAHKPRRHRGYRHHRPSSGYWGYPYGYGYGDYSWGYGYWGRCRWCWWYPWGATVYVESDNDSYHPDSGALDLDLNPERAQVFVDGRYVGLADDYDGFPAFLWLEEGTYDVVFYLPGYRTLARQYTVRPGVVIDVEDDLQPGESVRPEDLVSKSTERRDERIRRNEEREAEVAARERVEAERAREGRERPAPEQQRQEEVGRLYLSLWPDDAAIYLDGHFLGTAGELAQLSAGLVVEPGEHQLEVVHPGFQTNRRTVTVPPGQRIEVKFDLEQN